MDPAVKEAIQLAGQIHIPLMSWSQMMWHIMRHNPAASYSTGAMRGDAPAKELQLIGLVPANPDGHTAVYLPKAATASAVYIGPAFGQRYYGTGAVAMGLHPEQPKLAVFGLSFPVVPKGTTLYIGGPWIGAKPSDGLQFRASLVSSATKRVFPGPWHSTSEIFSTFAIKEPDAIDELWMDVRHPSKPKEFVRSYLPVKTPSAPMPARAEVLSDDPDGAKPKSPENAPLESVSTAPKAPISAVPHPGRGKALAVKLINPRSQQVGTSFEKVDYLVRWVPQSASYEFENTGAPRKAEFALYVAKALRSRTLRLKVNGTLIPTEGKITKTLWVDGMNELRYSVNLVKGLNRFEIYTPEELDAVNTNKLCCLLIGTPVVIAR